MTAIFRNTFRRILPMLAMAACAFSSPSRAAPAYEDDLKLLTYNVFFVQAIVSQTGQETRVGLIAAAPFMKDRDVVILNELFDHKAAQKLLDGLREEYPYRTPIVGEANGDWDATAGAWRPLTLGSGGVAILSRWPIVERVQYIYSQGCGADGCRA